MSRQIACILILHQKNVSQLSIPQTAGHASCVIRVSADAEVRRTAATHLMSDQIELITDLTQFGDPRSEFRGSRLEVVAKQRTQAM